MGECSRGVENVCFSCHLACVPYRIALCLLGPTKQEKQKKKLVDAMGFSEFKLDPTKQNRTNSLIYI